ncbi:MAG: class I SAM-dependent methyltransferase [Saprospiraceae bacterium]|nr:class I SAM-dependent methyltransferase [Saprospiraceae bacterium]
MTKKSKSHNQLLHEVGAIWDKLGRESPHWAVLTDERFADPDGVDEDLFFKTGQRSISEFRSECESLDINPGGRKALDFGCGLGRLTVALRTLYDQVDGVDVAPSMIGSAKMKHHDLKGVHFYLNQSEDLDHFENNAYDLIYSDITLQHIPKPLILKYLSEFSRVCKPGGLVVFQLPSHFSKNDLYSIVQRWVDRTIGPIGAGVRQMLGRPVPKTMSMQGIKSDVVIDFLEAQDLKYVDKIPNHAAGEEWVGYRYYFRKY